jgi:hypothetical protein
MEVKEAVKLIEAGYMDVSEMRDKMGLKSYQYARQMIVQNRYKLGDSTIELLGRTFVSRQVVAQAIKTRAERKEAE